MIYREIIIVGGGIAGLSSIEGLLADLGENYPQFISITLISDSRLIKRTKDYEIHGRNLENFCVEEDDLEFLFDQRTLPKNSSFKYIIGHVDNIDCVDRIITISSLDQANQKEYIKYDIVCLCCGSRPKELDYPSRNVYPELKNRLFVIKDTTTIESIQLKLKHCTRLAVIGNGGISIELISSIKNCNKTWVIRDQSVGLTFFDSGASKFLMDQMSEQDTSTSQTRLDRSEVYRSSLMKKSKADEDNSRRLFGPSLGPHWSESLDLDGHDSDNDLEIIYQDEINDIVYKKDNQNTPVVITTKSGRIVFCDLIATAIGVVPNKPRVSNGLLESSMTDGGILIDEQMRTSIPGIYAAGDVVSCEKWTKNDLWFQKRLWTQAKKMGFYAGRCIFSHLNNQDPSLYFGFDCFTHCTSFFGQKLVLLGRYNGQYLDDGEAKACEVIARVVTGKEYIKLLLKQNRIIGAVIIGDSGIEETIENLIYDQIDVSCYKDRLLDGSVDIEDYFD